MSLCLCSQNIYHLYFLIWKLYLKKKKIRKKEKKLFFKKFMWYFLSVELVLQVMAPGKVVLQPWSASESLGDPEVIWLGTCASYKLLGESEDR